ncbi:MAG TPA: hypothetical protein PKY82_27380 [Pyrinomonadaceae bacterium]|nr:hypothetical protein [Pyrinomonadaceae bacterium]
MKKYLYIVIIGLFFLTSCAKTTVNLTDYAQVCTDANKDKEVAVKGFLQVAEKVPCLKILNPKRDCSFKFLDKVNVVGNELIVSLPEGNGKNEVETPEFSNPPKPTSIFTRDQVKIHLNDGTIITPQADIATPAIVTGKVYLRDEAGQKKCSIDAIKVEKSE